MNYREEQQKKILRTAESGLMAVVVVDPVTEVFEVIFSDGAYREYKNHFHTQNFFYYWETRGIPQVFEDDRPRMLREISKATLQLVLRDGRTFVTKCRFLVNGVPAWCRVKAAVNAEEPGTIVLGIRNIDEDVRRLEELQENIREISSRNLTGQMQPHFLFNTLSSIREVVLIDPEYAADVLADFTTYLRAGLRAMSNDALIPFSKELETVGAYVRIEKMRFSDSLTVEYDLEVTDFPIIPFGVQPLVENAIAHGIRESRTGKGTVRIRTRLLSDCIEICVGDDGAGFDTKQVLEEINSGQRDSTALVNLRYRIYAMQHGTLEVWSAPGAGTTAALRIPV